MKNSVVSFYATKYFSRKNFAEEPQSLSESAMLKATAELLSVEKKKVIFNTVMSLNNFFKKANMRERCGLLASYSGNSDQASQISAARIFINMLDGVLSECGLYFRPKFENFQRTMQVSADGTTLTGKIYETRYTEPWNLTLSCSTENKLIKSSISIVIGDGREIYTYSPLQVVNGVQTLSTVEDLFRMLFQFVVKVCYKELLITNKDIEASGVGL